MLCVFLLSFHSVLNRNPAISSSDSSARESLFFFVSSLVNKQLGRRSGNEVDR